MYSVLSALISQIACNGRKFSEQEKIVHAAT